MVLEVATQWVRLFTRRIGESLIASGKGLFKLQAVEGGKVSY